MMQGLPAFRRHAPRLLLKRQHLREENALLHSPNVVNQQLIVAKDALQ